MTADAAPAIRLDEVALLRLLSLALAPPTAATVAEVCLLAGALAERPGAPTELAELCDSLASASAEELDVAYERLFAGDPHLPPYESSYEADPFRQARQLADVAGFYRAFDATAHGPAAERPDHAGCELEFLAFIGLRRLEAETHGRHDEAARCEEIETAFLLDHAGRWLPAFFARLATEAGSPYYRTLGRLAGRVVADELARRGLEPEPVTPRRSPRLSVEADELECGAPGLAG